MSSAKPTTNHDEIRKWAESHGGKPARVASTAKGGTGGVLRINFDEPGGDDDDRLEEIGWDEWFKTFDDSDLALLHGGGESRFNKLIQRQDA
ncbi:hypothetical protein HMF7854_14280 [Sphingomonas ginkgonis]|uniref:1,4-alpha-glucan branching enzyme n=1 Tax=Sphingomonas ginkgonis TaxID=2315330 RepID=A0A429VCX2_9SPHN|nr:hypothetical protein [Sphingomonas ginkgonis]RST31875.1 hypothetical protein HMF7854_14280 [Sphingomonas ginkgonis]